MQHQVSNKDKPKSSKMQNRKLDQVCTGVYIVLTKKRRHDIHTTTKDFSVTYLLCIACVPSFV